MARKKSRQKSPKKSRQVPSRIVTSNGAEREELALDMLMELVERTEHSRLSAAEVGKLKVVVETLAFLTQELENNGSYTTGGTVG